MRAISYIDEERGECLLLFNSRLAYCLAKTTSTRGITRGFFFFKETVLESESEIIEFPIIITGKPESFVLGISCHSSIKPIESHSVFELSSERPKKDFLIKQLLSTSMISFYDGHFRKEFVAGGECNPREFSEGVSISASRLFEPNLALAKELLI